MSIPTAVAAADDPRIFELDLDELKRHWADADAHPPSARRR